MAREPIPGQDDPRPGQPRVRLGGSPSCLRCVAVCIGYLYLREGRWKGQALLSPGFIRTATTTTDLPAPIAYYRLLLGEQFQRGPPDVPRDI